MFVRFSRCRPGLSGSSATTEKNAPQLKKSEPKGSQDRLWLAPKSSNRGQKSLSSAVAWVVGNLHLPLLLLLHLQPISNGCKGGGGRKIIKARKKEANPSQMCPNPDKCSFFLPSSSSSSPPSPPPHRSAKKGRGEGGGSSSTPPRIWSANSRQKNARFELSHIMGWK